MVFRKSLEKKQRNKAEIVSKKSYSVVKDEKLRRSKNYTNAQKNYTNSNL